MGSHLQKQKQHSFYFSFVNSSKPIQGATQCFNTSAALSDTCIFSELWNHHPEHQTNLSPGKISKCTTCLRKGLIWLKDQAPILILPVTHHAALERYWPSLSLSFLHCKMETITPICPLGCKITRTELVFNTWRCLVFPSF